MTPCAVPVHGAQRMSYRYSRSILARLCCAPVSERPANGCCLSSSIGTCRSRNLLQSRAVTSIAQSLAISAANSSPRVCTMARAARASASFSWLYRLCLTLTCCPCSESASSRVLSQIVAVIVLLNVVAIEPSKLVVASRFGRNMTPSGVVMDSGTETSTHAIAPLRSSPALLIERPSSRMFAAVYIGRMHHLAGSHGDTDRVSDDERVTI